MELIGWTGAILLALCALPLAWQSYRDKSSIGISNAFVAMWLVGEILTFTYVFPKQDIPLLVNYGFNIACLLVVIRYKFK